MTTARASKIPSHRRVDDKYLFMKDEVLNKGTLPVSLFPYARSRAATGRRTRSAITSCTKA